MYIILWHIQAIPAYGVYRLYDTRQQICGHTHQVNELTGCQDAQMRALVMIIQVFLKIISTQT